MAGDTTGAAWRRARPHVLGDRAPLRPTRAEMRQSDGTGPDVLAAVDIGTNSVHGVVARVDGVAASRSSSARRRWCGSARRRGDMKRADARRHRPRRRRPRPVPPGGRGPRAPDHGGGHVRGARGREPRPCSSSGPGTRPASTSTSSRASRRRGSSTSACSRRCRCSTGGCCSATSAVAAPSCSSASAGEVLGVPQPQAGRHPPHPAVLRRRPQPPGRGRRVPPLRPRRRSRRSRARSSGSTLEVAVGSSGTIAALCRRWPPPRRDGRPARGPFNNLALTRDELDESWCARWSRRPTARTRAELPGLDAEPGRHHPGRRAHPRAGGARARRRRAASSPTTRCARACCSTPGGAAHGGSLHHLSDLRRRSVLTWPS